LTTDGGIGLCIDVKHAYASETQLPVRLSPREFRRWQGSRCIYTLRGQNWHIFKALELMDE